MDQFKNSLNWFEIPVGNFERAKKFYSTIYNYEMPSITMGNSQLGFLPVQQGGIGGAIIESEDQVPSINGTRVYLNGGDDLNNILQRIEAAGGKVLLAKSAISEEHGYYALFQDTEGNKVALHSMK